MDPEELAAAMKSGGLITLPPGYEMRAEIPTFARLDEYSGVWAIEPTLARSTWAFASNPELLRAHMEEIKIRHPGGIKITDMPVSVEMVSMPSGKQSIADIRIDGLMMKAQPSMGGTSTVMVRKELRAAAANPDVAGILLSIDSGGGTVAGTSELGAEIKAAVKKKPVWAFIQDIGASAAYWAASQTEKVIANAPHAWVGSIGTLMVVQDLSAMAEKEGIKTLLFKTGPLKGMGTPGTPITQQHAEHIQGLVDNVQQSFDAAVRAGRGLSAKELTDVRHGGVLSATDALAAKLIDGIASKDKVLSDFANHLRAGRQIAQDATRNENEPLLGGLPMRELVGFPESQRAAG